MLLMHAHIRVPHVFITVLSWTWFLHIFSLFCTHTYIIHPNKTAENSCKLSRCIKLKLTFILYALKVNAQALYARKIHMQWPAAIHIET